MYILISIIALFLIAIVVFFFRKSKRGQRLTPLASISFIFIIGGIIFREYKLLGYGLIIAGVLLAIIDIIFKLESNKGGKMKFMSLLRKLGIYRSGSVKSTYKNGKDRPIELQEDGVFNSKKDLIKPKKNKGKK